jgi:hypothetical protein
VKLRRCLRCFDPDAMRAIVSAFRSVSEKADQAHFWTLSRKASASAGDAKYRKGTM